ncbi:MAG: transglutaminase domain-containing protein [Ilumatobacteraceae bacterium]|nr:transglutaminase domain-containing protein [Ilumatobacteraceae bacterium]
MTGPLDPTSEPTDADVVATWFLDADEPSVRLFARDACAGEADQTSRAVAIFAKVRDAIWYDPHSVSRDPADHRASAVVAGAQRWCVPKAVLLAASCRSVGIPARLGFADVRNHLQSPALSERMGTDVFFWHGYALLWLDGAWRKASPAFNRELCERFGTQPLAFDGVHDALLHAHDGDGRRHMEYLHHRGVYADLPLEDIFATFDREYPTSGSGKPGDPAFAPPA